MTRTVQLPYMRLEVISSLESMSDLQHQLTRWGRYEEGVSYYDDLTLNVHILYDDCRVLPDPRQAVPHILVEEEIPAFLELEQAFGPMLRDLGDSPDELYQTDSRWPNVIEAAGRALATMLQSDVEPRSWDEVK